MTQYNPYDYCPCYKYAEKNDREIRVSLTLYGRCNRCLCVLTAIILALFATHCLSQLRQWETEREKEPIEERELTSCLLPLRFQRREYIFSSATPPAFGEFEPHSISCMLNRLMLF